MGLDKVYLEEVDNDSNPDLRFVNRPNITLNFKCCDWFTHLPSGNYGEICIYRCKNFQSIGERIICKKLELKYLKELTELPQGTTPWIGKPTKSKFSRNSCIQRGR